MERFLLFVFAFINYQCWSQGNMITINSTVPNHLTVCGEVEIFSISIYNPSPFLLSNDTLKLTMPAGINYQLGSITGAIELNTSILNKPTFLLPNIATLSSLEITYAVSSKCDVMAFLTGGGIIENYIRVNYFANGISNYDDHTTGTFSIKQANLSITSITNQSYSGNIGDTFTRCITIANAGLGELQNLTFTDSHGSGVLIAAVDIGSWTNSGNFETIILNAADFLLCGDGDNLFESGESIIICETVKVLNCISVTSAFETFWVCDAQACQTSVSNGNVVFPNLVPNLVITPNNGNIYFQTNPCVTQASQQQLKIVNAGLGQATNVQLDIFQSTNSGYQNSVGSEIDPNSFTIQLGISGTANSIMPISTEATSSLSCMTNPIGRVLLTIPSINPGDTVYIKWNTYSCCYDACAGIGQYYINGWRYKGDYENICNNSYLIPETWGKVYSYIYGNLINNSSPSTLVEGQTGTFNFLFSNYAFWYPIGNGAHWKFEYTLPSCLNYAGNLHILHFAGLSTWLPSSVTVINNSVVAVFDGAAPFDLNQSEIKIDLAVNCGSCGGIGVDGALSIKSFYTPDTTCSCEVNISCQNAPLSIICPTPCLEGLNFSYFEMERTSYGLPDNEAGGGDGLPDLGGVLDFTKIKTDRVMFGDTISATFTGKVVTSINNPSWQYCFASASIANGNCLAFLDATLKIYRAGALIASCNNFSAPGNPIITNNGNVREFNYNLSVLSLGTCLPLGFAFGENDSLVFLTRYQVNANIGGSVPLNCYSTNKFYLSDIAAPVMELNKFQCGNFNGNVSIIGYYFTNYGPDNLSVISCNDVTISQNYYLSIGPCCNNYAGGNLFPYEYRNWSHISVLTAILPVGYSFVSAQFNQVRTAGTLTGNSSSWIPLAPNNPNSDTLTFPVEQYFEGFGGAIPLSDDGYYGTLQIIMKPSCEVTPIVSQGIRNDWTFAATPGNYLTGSGSSSTFVSLVHDSIVYQAPTLFIQATLPSINALNSDASWDITISNTSNVSSALNTWLSGPPISGVSITQVYDLDNSVFILPIGSIFPLGTINAGSVRNFKISAVYTSCFKDSIIVYSGWNCNAGYPISVNTYLCNANSIKLSLTPLVPALIVNIVGPSGTIEICDTASYTIEGVNVQLGTAYNVKLIAVLPLGISIISGSSQLNYPVSGSFVNISDPVFLSGTTWQWDISANNGLINSSGLKGILESLLNSFKITFKFITNCNYTSGSVLAFSLIGESACGLSTGQELTLSPPLSISNATIPYVADLNLITTYISPCANNSTMRVVVKNFGPASFGNSDSVFIRLPLGVSFVSGSFVGINNPPVISTPTQFILNSSIYLVWKLPVGINMGDSTVFTFDYAGNPQILSCAISEFELKTTSSTIVSCDLFGINCGINIITGATALSVYTYKAYLALNNGSAVAIPNPTTGETVTVNLDITNTGEAINNGANSIIEFYYDLNANGSYNSGDVLLTQDTLLITNNTTISYANTFNVNAGQACSLIAVIRSSVNPCVCNESQILLTSHLISLANDSTLCAGNSLVLGGLPINGYNYGWTPLTDLSNPNISNPILLASNLTATPLITDYILTVNRMTCISKDTIQITVNPNPFSNAGTDTSSCPVIALAELGVLPLAGYSYYWQPALYLSSIAISNPTTSLSNAGTITYTLTTTALGCSSSDSVTVIVNPNPTATIAGTIDVCLNSTSPLVTFTGIVGTPPFTFTYNLNGGPNQTITTSTGNSVSLAAPTNILGSYVYSLLSVQDGSSTNCSQVQNDTVSINVNTEPIVSINPVSAMCLSADSIILIGSPPGGVFNGLGVNGSMFNPAMSGAGAILISYTYFNGCTVSTNTTITVYPLPAIDTTALAIISANCGESDGMIQGIAIVSGQIPFQYIWSDTSNAIVGDSINLYNVPSGTYFLNIIDANACHLLSENFTILPKIVTAEFTANPTSGNSPLTVNFTNTSANATNYLWLFGNNDTSSVINPVYVYTPIENFTVCLIANYNGVCFDTTCSTINVLSKSIFLLIPNVFSPNNDGENDVFKIKTINVKTIEVEIFDRWGIKINSWNRPNGGWDGRTISGIVCSEGTYFFTINAVGTDEKIYFEKGYILLVN